MRALIGTSLMWIALSAISDGVSTLLLPVRLGVGDGSEATTLGLVTFVGLFAGMLAQPLVGSASDRVRPRFGRQGFLAIGVLLVIVGLAGMAVADTPLTIGLAFLWLSLALSFAQAPQQALMADFVPANRRGRAAGLKGFADLLGAMVGFAVLGSLLAGGDVRPALLALVIAIATLLVLVLVLLGRGGATGSVSTADEIRRGVLGAYRLDPRRDAAFIRAVIARFAFLLGSYAVSRFLVAYIASRLGLELGPAAETAGGLLTALALITALSSLPVGVLSDRWPRGSLMLGGTGAAIVGVAVLATAGNLGLIAVGGFLLAVGSALFGVANWATLVDLAPGSQAARYLGVANIGTAGAAAAAGLFGLLIDATDALAPGSGYLALFAAAAAAFLAGGLIAAAPYGRQVVPARSET